MHKLGKQAYEQLAKFQTKRAEQPRSKKALKRQRQKLKQRQRAQQTQSGQSAEPEPEPEQVPEPRSEREPEPEPEPELEPEPEPEPELDPDREHTVASKSSPSEELGVKACLAWLAKLGKPDYSSWESAGIFARYPTTCAALTCVLQTSVLKLQTLVQHAGPTSILQMIYRHGYGYSCTTVTTHFNSNVTTRRSIVARK